MTNFKALDFLKKLFPPHCRLVLIVFTIFLRVTSVQGEPAILRHPTSQVIYGGNNLTLSVEPSGLGPFSYQWRVDGTNLADQIITTVAGNGKEAYSGDGVPGNHTAVYGPYGLVTDRGGNLYIAEYHGNRIRKIDTNGVSSTVAGNGTEGFSGDEGTATKATFRNPTGLAFDSAGNLYVADYLNDRVRKIDTNGSITTFAGGGNLIEDGGAATNALIVKPLGLVFDNLDNLYVSDGGHDLIRKVTPAGIITTVINNGLVYPTGVALDSQANLYIAACNNNQVFKVDTNGLRTVFAGTGSNIDSGDGGPANEAGVSYPRGMVADEEGNIYMAIFYDNRVRVVDTNGIIKAFAGAGGGGFSGDNGDALAATFQNLVGIARDTSGKIYVSDFFNHRVREIMHPERVLQLRNIATSNTGDYSVVISDASGSITSRVATVNVVLPPSILQQPQSQQVLVASNLLLSIYVEGTFPLHYQWSFNGTNLVGATNNSFGLEMATTNDAGNYTVSITNNFGSITSKVATLKVVALPPEISVHPASPTIPSGSNVVLRVTATGSPPLEYQWSFNAAILNGETNLSLNLFEATTNQSGAYRVVVNSPYGSSTSRVANVNVIGPPKIATQSANQSVQPGERAVLAAEVLGTGPLTFQWKHDGTNLLDHYMTTVAGNRTFGFSGDGGFATNARLREPYGVATDRFGNLFVADTENHRVRKVTLEGIITTVAGSGTRGLAVDGVQATNSAFREISGIAVDEPGNLFIADTFNNRIRKVDTNGIISTIAGSGNSLDGLRENIPATNATLAFPKAIAVGLNGELYVSDSGRSRICKIDSAGFIKTVAGNPKFVGFSGDGGPATSALLRYPEGLAVDSAGNLYIADSIDYRVRKVDVYGTITTFAGNGSITFSGDGGPATAAGVTPTGLAMDRFGNLLIVSSRHHNIRRVDAFGTITTVAGTGTVTGNLGDGGSAPEARLFKPSSVAVDGFGRILVADTGLAQIRRFGFGPSLLLQNVSDRNAGDYTLEITSPFGTLNSSNLTLTVIAQSPSVAIQKNLFGSVTLNVSSRPNTSSRLFSTTNLVSPIVWTPIATNLAPGPWQFIDTNTFSQPFKIYRSSTP